MVSLKRFIILSIGLLQLCLIAAPVSAASIVVSSDRNPVGLNESFQLVYETEGDVDGDPDFSVLETQLDILNRSQSSNISIINGSYSSKKNWTLSVMAKHQGKLVLPPVSFGSDKSPAYNLTVNQASQTDRQSKEFFTRVRVNQKKVYVQQQLVITQQLFSAYNLSAYALGELKFGGIDVVVEPLGEEKQYRTRLDGQAYVVVEKQFALFPQQSGALKLEPIIAEGQTGSRSSLYNSFARGKVVRARTEEIEVEVMDVPASADMSPWLPATDFQLLEQWAENPPKFVQGEPLTRTLSIKAEGLSAAQLPVLPDISIDGFKQYPDQPILENIKNDGGLSGYRLEKVAFIPTRAGKFTLPAIEIPWWNTATQQREVARIAQREIEVAPSPTAAQAQPVAPVAQPLIEPQVSPPTAPAPSPEIVVESDSRWLWLAVFALLGWLATAVSWFVFSRSKAPSTELQPDSGQLPQREAFKQLLESCKQADAARCRSTLLQWARLYFSAHSIVSVRDLRGLLPAEVMRMLADLDANLYGGAQHRIDFAALAELLKQFVKNAARQSTKNVDLLQPLYK